MAQLSRASEAISEEHARPAASFENARATTRQSGRSRRMNRGVGEGSYLRF